MRLLSCLTVLAVAVFGVACSESTSSGPKTSGGVASITVTPSDPVLSQGMTRSLSAVAKDAAGSPVTVELTWKSSSAGVATVDATGHLTAVAEGLATISATYGAKSGTVKVTVTDSTSWPTAEGTSSAELIRTALEQGALTSEQALIYQVYAAFVDSRLPVAYRGAPEEGIDNPILMEVHARYLTLSPATKAILKPFFIDPGYAGSWYQARVGGVTSAAIPLAAPSASPSAGAPRAQLSTAECLELVGLFFFKEKTTAHFRIHYAQTGDGSQYDQLAAMTANIVAAEAEKIWSIETSTFGREPMPDGAFADNGCDGLIDIWIYDIVNFEGNNPKTVIGKVVPYLEGACQTAAKIHLKGETDARKIRNTLAHEFFHLLELGSYTRPNCLSEYFWLGEATGNWAMDLVYKDDNFEHNYAAAYAYADRWVPIDEIGEAGKDANGYVDYVFLLYLSRGYGDATIKDIWDATEGANSVQAIVNALQSREGIRKVWPEFALALWNDYGASNQDDLHTWDNLEWGMKKAFDLKDAGGQFGKPSTKVDMEGAGRKTFETLKSTKSSAAGHELPRLSIHADYFKFTDPTVSSVLYTNGLALATLPNLKIQAMIKKGGSWGEVEDWTGEGFKSYCLDLKDERVEELVLIYSNSDGNRPAQPIPFMFAPSVNVSNVGCGKWQGTTSIEHVVSAAAGGGSSIVSATNVVLERLRYPGLPDGTPGAETFTNVSAAITGSNNAAAACITQVTQGGAAAEDAELMINLDNMVIGTLSPPPDREILQAQASSWLSTTSTHCNGTVVVADYNWSWFNIPLPGYFVSADGRTIEGTVVETGPVGVRTSKWKLTAVREP